MERNPLITGKPDDLPSALVMSLRLLWTHAAQRLNGELKLTKRRCSVVAAL